MAYLQSFLLPGTLCMAMKKELQGITKGQKTQSEETEQAPKSDVVGMLGF